MSDKQLIFGNFLPIFTFFDILRANYLEVTNFIIKFAPTIRA